MRGAECGRDLAGECRGMSRTRQAGLPRSGLRPRSSCRSTAGQVLGVLIGDPSETAPTQGERGQDGGRAASRNTQVSGEPAQNVCPGAAPPPRPLLQLERGR